MAAAWIRSGTLGPVKRGVGVAVLSVVALATAWLVWHHAINEPAGAKGAVAAPDWIKLGADGAGAEAGQAQPPLRTGLEALPRSLAGTEVDGAAQADGAGHLKLDRSLRNLFDYFLSLVGEEPPARVRARIVAYLRSHLPASAAAEGVSLLDRYLAYEADRGQQGEGQPHEGDSAALSVDSLSQRMSLIQGLRQRYFSVAERQAFFGDEEAFDQYTLKKLAVMQDGSLSAVDKAQRLRQLVEALPAALRTNLTAVDSYEDLQAVTADWKARGGTPEALHEARVQLVGAEATARLEALDTQRAQWGLRVHAYQAQKARLLADASLSPLQREQAVQQLLTGTFNAQERLRVGALDEAGGHP